jgi:hypothetical protein
VFDQDVAGLFLQSVKDGRSLKVGLTTLGNLCCFAWCCRREVEQSNSASSLAAEPRPAETPNITLHRHHNHHPPPSRTHHITNPRRSCQSPARRSAGRAPTASTPSSCSRPRRHRSTWGPRTRCRCVCACVGLGVWFFRLWDASHGCYQPPHPQHPKPHAALTTPPLNPALNPP